MEIYYIVRCVFNNDKELIGHDTITDGYFTSANAAFDHANSLACKEAYDFRKQNKDQIWKENRDQLAKMISESQFSTDEIIQMIESTMTNGKIAMRDYGVYTNETEVYHLFDVDIFNDHGFPTITDGKGIYIQFQVHELEQYDELKMYKKALWRHHEDLSVCIGSTKPSLAYKSCGLCEDDD